MVLSFVRGLQNLWPFSRLAPDDLRSSDDLVRKLPIPDHTKQFVYAVRETGSRSVVYVLAVQNLSDRSAADSDCLVRAVRPDAVLVQMGNSGLSDVMGDRDDDAVPTSSFEVLRRCFVDKIGREEYEDVASGLVTREIFGVGFNGHFLAARKAALDVGSSFVVLESSFLNDSGSSEEEAGDVQVANMFRGFKSSLVPLEVGLAVSSGVRMTLGLGEEVRSQMVKVLTLAGEPSIWRLMTGGGSTVDSASSNNVQPRADYEAPPFAQTIYPLLLDLHDVFRDIPAIGRALFYAQKMLVDVNKGKVMDSRTVSEVYSFRIAVEGLRMALNTAARLPVNKPGNPAGDPVVNFPDLPFEDKAHALFAHALRSQAKKSETVVAIVDASSLGGLRKHWNTPLPSEIEDLVGKLPIDREIPGENGSERRWIFSSKPVVAVGAGASAVIGASSLSQVLPMSTFMKLLTFKLPASLKILLFQSQKVLGLALPKSAVPFKLMSPGLAKSAASPSMLKATASAQKIRAVTHGMIASAEKTSFSAMRTAFYEIMRKRKMTRVGYLPWTTFGCSMLTCSGLLMYGDGLECAAESLPSAPSIASLGRGIRSLREASRTVKDTDFGRIQKSIELLMSGLKKAQVQ